MILDSTLLSFLEEAYPDGHKFMQDNDPKHTSRHAKLFIEEKGINWWKTPAESPDLNPIENLWHESKEYIKREVKPKTKEQLIDGIGAQSMFRSVENVLDICEKLFLKSSS